MTASFTFQRGEPMVLGDLFSGDPALSGHSMRARMKPAPVNGSKAMPGDSVPVVSPPFTTTFVLANGDVREHYLHSMTAAQTATLAAGRYLYDSSLLLDGVVIKTRDPVLVIIANSASAVA